MAANELDVSVEVRARRAYEWGRLRWSLRVLPLLAVAGAVALACGRPAGLCCALLAALAPLAIGLSFAGGRAGQAVGPGLAAGSFALALPLAVRTIGHVCAGDACMALCLPSCILGGAAGGAFLALRAAKEQGGAAFIAAGMTIAGLMGALGCTLAGVAGVVGMAAGALAAGAPVLALRPRRP